MLSTKRNFAKVRLHQQISNWRLEAEPPAAAGGGGGETARGCGGGGGGGPGQAPRVDSPANQPNIDPGHHQPK